MCHTRIMAGGAVVKGAQGNFPFDRALRMGRTGGRPCRRDARPRTGALRCALADPGSPGAPSRAIQRGDRRGPRRNPCWCARTSQDEPIESCSSAGSHRRAGPAVPRSDRSAAPRRHRRSDAVRRPQPGRRRPGELRRLHSRWTGVQDAARTGQVRPYSDEQLHALALYIYSLRPPPNPNKRSPLTARGERIFNDRDNRCATCHKPPLYTNNELTIASGFEVRSDHPDFAHIMKRSVETDPTLSLRTRRGTGLYKVPSLVGVWYRGPFEHSGSVLTLEDWFDARRTRDDYVPTGWKGCRGKRRMNKLQPLPRRESPYPCAGTRGRD